jgi:hypothetical protein
MSDHKKKEKGSRVMISWGKKRPISLLACVAALVAPCLAHADFSAGSTTVPAVASTDTSAAPASSAGATSDSSGAASSPSPAAPASTPGQDQARDALKQKTGDASSEKNLQDVFKAAQPTYSLLKAGGIDMTYAVNYSYFRDSVIDVALNNNSSAITRFRIEDDAAHTFSNDISLDYGVWDNLTANFDLPLISKFDTISGLKTTGLGDVSAGWRWQPFPVRMGLPTTTLFGSLSTRSGTSPYEIDLNNNLSTGKGFYALSGGVSINKVIDPVVLFASGSFSYGIPITGVNQLRGSRILKRVDPGDSFGLSFGMAYSLNYDVSVSSSVQLSAGLPTKFTFTNGDVFNSSDSVTSTLNLGVSLRTSPKRIVNLSFGLGLTPDSPNLILGFNLPVDIAGFTTGQ